MRKKWMLALLGAAVCAVMPAAALADGSDATHHTKRHHRAHIRVRHLHAASTDSAGSVTSFDGSTLVVTLTNGSTVSGAVANDIEMSCDSSGRTTSMQSDARSDGGSGGGGDRGRSRRQERPRRPEQPERQRRRRREPDGLHDGQPDPGHRRP